jgi:hypothetical protein
MIPSNVKLLISLIKKVNVMQNGTKMSLSPKLIKSFIIYPNGYRTFTILKMI